MVSSVVQWLNFLDEKYKDNIAFQYYDEEVVKQVSYAQFVRDVKKFVAYLNMKYERIEEMHVGILGRNSYQYLVCLYGIMAANAVAVPLNIEEMMETVEYQIGFADITCVFTDGEYEKLEPEFGSKYADMLIDMEAYTDSEEYTNLEECKDVQKLAMILFTSGTTGKSKGVMMSQKNLLAPLNHFLTTINTAEKNMNGYTPKIFLIVPLYHISGIGSALAWITNGSTINICASPKYMYRDLKYMRSDTAFVVPTILKLWSKEIRKGKYEKLGGIRNISCGAAVIEPQMLQEFRENGISIYQAYGMTEICGGGTVNASMNPEKIKSVGLPGAGCFLKIEDDEVCLKSDAVMMGYYKDIEETHKTIKDGWLHTGDLGYLDEDGYLYLTGRKKNLIILSSGENVSPEELEELLLRNTLIEEVLVKAKGDRISAQIFCRQEKRKEIEEYIKELNKTLAFYKRISDVEFCKQPLLKTTTGKVVRG